MEGSSEWSQSLVLFLFPDSRLVWFQGPARRLLQCVIGWTQIFITWAGRVLRWPEGSVRKECLFTAFGTTEPKGGRC